MTGPHTVLLIVKIIAAVMPLCVAAAFYFRPRRKTRPRPFLSGFLAVCAVGWALAIWAFTIEPATLAVRRVTIDSPQWSGAPLRIGVISDTHVSSLHVDAARVRDVVARMNALKPDIVVLLGDYTGSHEPADQRPAEERAQIVAGIEAFATLRAPLGVVGILGNHDWWYDGPDIERAMIDAKIVVLANNAVRIDRSNGAFNIAGLESLSSKRALPSSVRAMRNAPSDEPVILLMHEPDAFADAPATVALSLAGHTHCGQVRLPFVGAVVLPSAGSRRWPCGLYDQGGRKLYVTGGVGTSILPVRLSAGPEIALVTLRAPTT